MDFRFGQGGSPKSAPGSRLLPLNDDGLFGAFKIAHGHVAPTDDEKKRTRAAIDRAVDYLLLLSDPVDSFWTALPLDFGGKPFKSLSKGDVDFGLHDNNLDNTIGAIIGIPLGIAAAIYLEEYAHDSKFNRFIVVNIRNLAGVPAVIYGVLGLTIFVGWLDPITQGKTVIAAWLIARRDFRGRLLARGLVMLPWALPGTVIAIGLLWIGQGTGVVAWPASSSTVSPASSALPSSRRVSAMRCAARRRSSRGTAIDSAVSSTPLSTSHRRKRTS